MPTNEEWNQLVNSKWPKDMPIPSAQEAITGAKRLYRRAMGKPFPGKVVAANGNRFTWVRQRVLYVNPSRRGAFRPPKGWPDIVHLLAHYCHHRRYPNARPHSHQELDLEADLTRYAIENGFHQGRLHRAKASKPKPSRKEKNHLSALASLKRWQTKLKRAETGVKKYQKKVRYYEKTP